MKGLIFGLVTLALLLVAAGEASAHRRVRVVGVPHHNGQVRGGNTFFSPGGRALVFVGFDRFGNPIFR